MNYYWELIQFDGTRLEIPPEAVDTIKRRMDNGQPIHTAHSGSIPANQIKTFRPTDKQYVDQPLLEDVARAFNEPVINEDGSVQAKWVKKDITQFKWDKVYSAGGYKKLDDNGGMVTVAFRLPVHEIDQQVISLCTDEEVTKLQQYS